MTASAHQPFADRREAGLALVGPVQALGLDEPVVLALPRGGVPVAAEVARALGCPLDAVVVRKIGHPRQPELAVGAVAEGGATVLDAARASAVDPDDLARVVADEQVELDRRIRRYRGGRPMPEVAGRDVVVVDDGLATGATATVAVEALRRAGARRVVVAVPVASADALDRLAEVADDVVAVRVPSDFRAVGLWYRNFAPVPDRVVQALLAASDGPHPPG